MHKSMEAELQALKAEIEVLKVELAHENGRSMALEAGLLAVLDGWGKPISEVEDTLGHRLEASAFAAIGANPLRVRSAAIESVGTTLMGAVGSAAKRGQ